MIAKQVKQDKQLKIIKKPTHRMNNKMENKQKRGKMKKEKHRKRAREK